MKFFAADRFFGIDAMMTCVAEPAAEVDAGAVSISVHDRFDAIEPLWRELEETGICSAYQRYDWTEAWQRHIGQRINMRPVIVIGTEQARPVMLLPFGLIEQDGLRVLRFMGGTHSNYNLGIYDRDFMIRANAAHMRRMLHDMTDVIGRLDLFELRNQPATWLGLRNPFTMLAHSPTASAGHSTLLASDFDALFRERRGKRGRKKLKWQERALESVGGYEVRRAESLAEAHKVLAVFAEQKAARFNAQGIRNVFADVGVMDFLHELADRTFSSNRQPPLEVYYLTAGGKIRATMAGAVGAGRFSGFFNSISSDDLTRVSPGELLLTKLIGELCGRGIREFDLGVGEGRYKAAWCDHTDQLFDTLYGVSFKGKASAALLRAKLSAKRRIKQNEALWALATETRARLFGDRDCGCPPQEPADDHP